MTERDAVRGPGYWNVDFGLSKRVRFGTRAVQFRLEAYNLFNHANMFREHGHRGRGQLHGDHREHERATAASSSELKFEF